MKKAPAQIGTAPRFLVPLVEEYNQSVAVLEDTTQAASFHGNVQGMKLGKSVAISVTTPFTFCIVEPQQRLYRGRIDIKARKLLYTSEGWRLTSEAIMFIRSDAMTGFIFAGTDTRVMKMDAKGRLYYVMQDGVQYARFVIEESLPEGGSIMGQPVDYVTELNDDDKINECELHAPWGGTHVEDGESKEIGCFWNDALLRWEAGIEKCDETLGEEEIPEEEVVEEEEEEE